MEAKTLTITWLVLILSSHFLFLFLKKNVFYMVLH